MYLRDKVPFVTASRLVTLIQACQSALILGAMDKPIDNTHNSEEEKAIIRTLLQSHPCETENEALTGSEQNIQTTGPCGVVECVTVFESILIALTGLRGIEQRFSRRPTRFPRSECSNEVPSLERGTQR
jgi:hypothetical protein